MGYVSNSMATSNSNMQLDLPDLPIFVAIARHESTNTAVIQGEEHFSYGRLCADIAFASEKLRAWAGESRNAAPRVGFLVESSYEYVVTLLSILAAGGIAIPLALEFPISELAYNVQNGDISILLASGRFKHKAEAILETNPSCSPKLMVLDAMLEPSRQCYVNPRLSSHNGQGGLMVYTSGTTSQPKGVLLPHSALAAQSKSLIEAWRYSELDLVLNILPLHHLHGILTALITPLFAGSTIEFQYPFDPDAVFNRFAAPFLHTGDRPRQRPITMFTAVPSIYDLMLRLHPSLPGSVKAASREALKAENLRLNVSGSASLPRTIRNSWTELSQGNVLLERYGMTELGMAISCGLAFDERIEGSVGWPLPGVDVRLVDEKTGETITDEVQIGEGKEERFGEIYVRGPTVFKEYWRNDESTRRDFHYENGSLYPWFKTGDIATRKTLSQGQSGEQEWTKGPAYFIKGRNSVDILKSGGEKVSALEVERELLSLPQIKEAAVIGIVSEGWGQRIAAVVVLSPSKDGEVTFRVKDMRKAMKDRLASHKIPQVLKIVKALPKNALGKVNKKELERTFSE